MSDSFSDLLDDELEGPESHGAAAPPPAEDPSPVRSPEPVHAATPNAAAPGAAANGTAPETAGISLHDGQRRELVEQLRTTIIAENAYAEAQSRTASGLSAYLTILRRRWQPMLALFIVTTAIVTWKLKPGPVQYAAITRMLLPTQSQTNSQTVDLSAATGDTTATATGVQIATVLAIVTSPPLVRQAIGKLDPDLRRRGWVQLTPTPTPAPGAIAPAVNLAAISWWNPKWGTPANPTLPVTAVSTVSSDIVDITATAANPDAAIALANGMVGAYSDMVQAQSDVNNVKNLAFTGKQLHNVEIELQNAKKKLQLYKEQHHIFDVSQSLTASTQRIVTLEDQALAARTEANAGATGATIQNDSIANSLQQKSADLHTAYATIRREYTADSPEAIAAAATMRDGDAQVTQRISALLKASAYRAKEADNALALAKAEAAKLPSLEYGISLLTANVDTLSDTYKTLDERYTQLSINKDADLLPSTALNPATAAALTGGTWASALALAMIAGLTLACLWASLLEHLDNSLHSSQDAEILLHAPALSTMPMLRGKAERRLSHIENPHLNAAALLEACRLLRTNLAFAAPDRALKSILVTSADPGEGKSLSASNLATAMAMDGRRVILLDCDLRRPMQQLLHELPLEPGFTNVLLGEVTLAAALQSTRIENLRVMPAGTLPSNPPELLGSPRTREVLAELRGLCDIVVIDSAPVMALSDSQVLCSLTDGVLLVVGADSTAREHVQRAQAALRQAGGKLLGVLFNKARNYNNVEINNAYYTYAGQNGKGKIAGALGAGKR